MKERVLRKSLFLKKETIAHLNLEQMGILLAGCGTVTIGACRLDPDIMDDPAKPSDNTCLTNESDQNTNN